jgi:hypothetical protein
VREIADRIYDSFAETPQWTRQGWAAKLSPHIREGISEVRKPLVDALKWISSECGREAGLRADAAIEEIK